MAQKSSATAYPVRILREHVFALVSAAKDCGKSPEVEAVHRLRTGTRRIEGQLALFAAIPGFTKLPHGLGLQRMLKRMRRAAGGVRDLDVQLKAIDDLRLTAATGRDRKRLHDFLAAERSEAADALSKTLKRYGKEFRKRLEDLVRYLKDEKDLALEPQRVAELARVWFASRVSAEAQSTDDAERLHTIRKAAKLARYIAENAPRSPNAAKRIADQFEAVQEAGGEWHDQLILSQIAAERLGDSSPLTKTLAQHADKALAMYLQLLRSTLAQISETPLRLSPPPAAEADGRRPRALRRR